MLFCLFFSLNYCFAAVVLIATNKVEYIYKAQYFRTSRDNVYTCISWRRS